jgi:hypothetical protein
MFANRELLGKGLEHLVVPSKSPDLVLKIPRLDWIAAQWLLGLNATERTKSNVRLFNQYFSNHSLDTTLRTVEAVRLPLTTKYLFPKRQIIIQEKMCDHLPLEGTLTDLSSYQSQLEDIAKRNRQLFIDTGFTLDLFSSEYLLPTIYKLATDQSYWGLPNLFAKDGQIRINDFGLFQIKNPQNPIDFLAKLNLGTLTHVMSQRLGIKFLP